MLNNFHYRSPRTKLIIFRTRLQMYSWLHIATIAFWFTISVVNFISDHLYWENFTLFFHRQSNSYNQNIFALRNSRSEETTEENVKKQISYIKITWTRKLVLDKNKCKHTYLSRFIKKKKTILLQQKSKFINSPAMLFA